MKRNKYLEPMIDIMDLVMGGVILTGSTSLSTYDLSQDDTDNGFFNQI